MTVWRLIPAGLLALSAWGLFAGTSDQTGKHAMMSDTHVTIVSDDAALDIPLEVLPGIEAAFEAAVTDADALTLWKIPEVHAANFPSTVSETYVREGDGRVYIGDWELTTDGQGLRGLYTPLSDSGARMGVLFRADLAVVDQMWVVTRISTVRMR